MGLYGRVVHDRGAVMTDAELAFLFNCFVWLGIFGIAGAIFLPDD